MPAEIELKLAIDPGVAVTAAASRATRAVAAIRSGPGAHGAGRQHVLRHAGLAPRRCGHRAARAARRHALGADGQGPAARDRPAALCTRAANTNGRCTRPRSTPFASRRRRGAGSSATRSQAAASHRASRPISSGRRSPLAFPDGTRASPASTSAKFARSGTRRTRRRTRACPIAEIEIELESGQRRAAVRARARARRRSAAGASPRPTRPSAARRSCRDVPTDGTNRAGKSGRAAAGRPTAGGAARASPSNACNRSQPTRPGSSRDDDPEWIHQMRIGTRRLRAASRSLARRSRRRVSRRCWPRSNGSPAHSVPRATGTCSPPRRCRRLRSARPRTPRRCRRASRRMSARARRQRARGTRRGARRVRSPRFQPLVLAVGDCSAVAGFRRPGRGAMPAPRRPSARRAFARRLLRAATASSSQPGRALAPPATRRAACGAHRGEAAALRRRVLRAAPRMASARATIVQGARRAAGRSRARATTRRRGGARARTRRRRRRGRGSVRRLARGARREREPELAQHGNAFAADEALLDKA